MDSKLNVREIEAKDLESIARYWFESDADYLKSLGVDTDKLPEREQFIATVASQVALPYNEKRGYALIWEVGGESIGHCNVNPLTFGDHAFMHLHMWNPDTRRKGLGVDFVKMSLPYFFNNLQLTKLYCEPYALNEAPNRLLEKAGFKFVKEYVTTPGSITFEQPVKRWQIERP